MTTEKKPEYVVPKHLKKAMKTIYKAIHDEHNPQFAMNWFVMLYGSNMTSGLTEEQAYAAAYQTMRFLFEIDMMTNVLYLEAMEQLEKEQHNPFKTTPSELH